MRNLPPGPELDALIAEKVMAWERSDAMPQGAWARDKECETAVWWRRPGDSIWSCSRCWSGECPRPYSTSIADAWTVVEKLIQLFGGDIHIECLNDEWGVSTCYQDSDESWNEFIRGDTAPLAICYAALKAVK